MDIEAGHRVSSLCYLGNLAWRESRTIKWDWEAESVLFELHRSRLGGFPLLLVETESATDEWLMDGIRMGARGVLSWPVSVDQLRQAIDLAANDGSVLGPLSAALLLKHVQLHCPESRLTSLLTPAEVRVSQLLMGAMSNKEIAGELQPAVSTVETHISRLFRKLKVQSRGEAIIKLNKLRMKKRR